MIRRIAYVLKMAGGVCVGFFAMTAVAVAQINLIGDSSGLGVSSGGAKLQNPLQFSSIADFVAGFLRAIVMISLPVITLFIVYAGAQFILARGNKDALGRARENFMWVIIGTLLILGAWVIATLIGGTISQLTSG